VVATRFLSSSGVFNRAGLGAGCQPVDGVIHGVGIPTLVDALGFHPDAKIRCMKANRVKAPQLLSRLRYLAWIGGRAEIAKDLR